MTNPKKIHIASKFYLSRWAGSSGRLAVVRPPRIDSFERQPEKVGRRHRYWGSDGELCAQIENAIGPIESAAAEALNTLPWAWRSALRDKRRIDISLFIALQILRAPSSRARHLEIETNQVRSSMTEYEETLSETQVQDLVAYLTSDAFRVESELQTTTKLAGMIASMHWTLVEFSEPLLGVCDQPVQVVPYVEPGGREGLKTIPDRGILAVHEIRFPIDPFRFIFLSWRDGFDTQDSVSGDDWIAAQMNRVTFAQTDREWFHHPDRRPTALHPPDLGDSTLSSLAPAILDGYSIGEFSDSARRKRISEIVNRLIDEGDHETIGLIVPSVDREAA